MLRTSKPPSLNILIFVLLLTGTAAVFLLNVGAGSAEIGVRDILRIVFGNLPQDDSASMIIRRIRAPRACAALVGGAALAVAGLLLQTFFANPIVEPYILGISSGSSLFVAAVVLGGVTAGFGYVTPLLIFSSAFAGALSVTAVVILAARRVRSMLTLLIIGIMSGYLCGAATSILSAFAEREAVVNFAMWTMGTFAGFTWRHLRIMFAIVMPMLLLSVCLAKPLNALALGDNYAVSMGVNVKGVRCAIIFISSILTAAVTAFAGPISFIGLAVPHMCRIVFFTSDCRILIPAAALGGAFISGLCDFAARNIMSPRELPLAAITAIIGAPIVVWLLTSRRHSL